MFRFYTDIIKKDVVDRRGRWIGRPFDFKFAVDEAYPRLSALVVLRRRFPLRFSVIPWDHVQRVDEHFQINALSDHVESLKHYYTLDDYTLKKDVLDKQVVDTFNRKVVRVNDVHLMQVANQYRLVHVDVSLRGLVRRLGWERFIDKMMGWFKPTALYLKRDGLISWKFVQTLSIHPTKKTIHLNVKMEELHNIPPSDMSEMLAELDSYQRTALYGVLDLETQIDSLKEIDMHTQVELVLSLPPKRAVQVVEGMPSDEAADLLRAMRRSDADRFFTKMNSKKARKLSSLIAHESDSAGGLMTTEMVMLPPDITVSEAIERIRAIKEPKETIYYVYVVDNDQHLLGVVSFREMLIASPDQLIHDIMSEKPVSVHIDSSAKEIAYVMDKYNFIVIPVVDDDDILHGIISMDDILSLVISEAWGKKTGLL